MDKLKTLLFAVLASLSPLKAVVITVLALVLLDFITGILASLKRKQPIESYRLKATVLKLTIYQLCVIMSFYVGLYLIGPEVPLLKITTTLIGLTEVKSVLENFSIIAGNSLFSALGGLLSPSRKPTDESGGFSEGK